MVQPLETMLARWPLLYPEITDAGEQDNRPGETDRIRQEVVAPLLDSGGIFQAFEERREEYQRWQESLSGTEEDLESVLAQEDRFHDALAAIIEEQRDEMGERAVKAVLGGINLRRIVREATLPYRDTWPEESWHRIAHLMASNDLCHAGILEYLSTGEGNRANIETLAGWGFQYAMDAYWDAGYYGQHSTKLEDIPE